MRSVDMPNGVNIENVLRLAKKYEAQSVEINLETNLMVVWFKGFGDYDFCEMQAKFMFNLGLAEAQTILKQINNGTNKEV